MRVQLWLSALTFCCAFASANSRPDNHSRLAIIIDDIGYNQTLSARAARLKGDFTLAVLPFTQYGLSSAQLARTNHKELMLHAPMSNTKDLPLGRGGLSSVMGKQEFIAVLRKDLDYLPAIKGVNNHMGSRLTQEAEAMGWLMAELKSRNLYFVDSRTSPLTVALDTARAHRIPSHKRDVFLDNDPTSAAISRQLDRAVALAKQQGSAIAIGHPYPATLTLLENIQPLLLQHNISLVFVSQLFAPAEWQTADAEIQAELPATGQACAAPPPGLWFQPHREMRLEHIPEAIILQTFFIP